MAIIINDTRRAPAVSSAKPSAHQVLDRSRCDPLLVPPGSPRDRLGNNTAMSSQTNRESEGSLKNAPYYGRKQAPDCPNIELACWRKNSRSPASGRAAPERGLLQAESVIALHKGLSDKGVSPSLAGNGSALRRGPLSKAGPNRSEKHHPSHSRRRPTLDVPAKQQEYPQWDRGHYHGHDRLVEPLANKEHEPPPWTCLQRRPTAFYALTGTLQTTKHRSPPMIKRILRFRRAGSVKRYRKPLRTCPLSIRGPFT